MAASGLMAVGPAPTPKWLIFIKGAIIILSVIVLALAAYALSLYGRYTYYSGGAPGYLIFLVIKTWIIYGLDIAFQLRVQHLYYRIGFLIAYILSIIFWLSGWAWAASWASVASAYSFGYNDTFGGVMGGCAGLGAIIWILAIVNLVFFILASVREPSSTGNVELGHAQKQDQQPYTGQPAQPQQQQYAGQPQQPYAAQPGQPQQQQPAYGQPQQQGYPQQNYATQ
ncbi:hypothetical protein JX266_004409 [Neoarthrinium moseri]|nr:hypothetical protein JX266_004409 [Neoarthrinium moseri]